MDRQENKAFVSHKRNTIEGKVELEFKVRETKKFWSKNSFQIIFVTFIGQRHIFMSKIFYFTEKFSKQKKIKISIDDVSRYKNLKIME